MSNVLTPAEIESLLSKLCIELGFCLPAESIRKLQTNPPEDPLEFTKNVFIFEGLNPDSADKHLYRQVRDMIIDAYARGSKLAG